MIERVGRMRRRVLAAWIAQGLLVAGLGLSVVAAGSLGAEDWSFIAVMTILTAIGLALWVRFSFGLPLLLVDLVYLAMGLAIGAADYGLPAPFGALPRLVSALWVVGGILGTVALVASTQGAGRPRDDIDSTAY